MIDTSKWKEFRVGDLFDIHPTKAYKMTNVQLLDGGEYPVVANSAYNNGIGGYSTQKPTEKGNMITFSDTVDANTIFYQPNDFVGYPHVQGLYPIRYEDKWNKYTYSFFVSVFRGTAISKGFDYGNKFRRDIAVELTINLPLAYDGEPDWGFMESYMKRIMKESEEYLENLRRAGSAKRTIGSDEWGIFNVGDLFDIHPTKAYNLTNNMLFSDKGNNPVVVNSGFNNGVGGYTDYECTEKAGIITFTDTAAKSSESFFYQNNDFVGYPHVQGMYPKNHKMTEAQGRFIATVLRASVGKYDFISKMTRTDIAEMNIRLPIKGNGSPDWQYMEDYMRDITEKASETLSALKTVV